MPQKVTLLVLRFSAMGDVAMTIPVLEQFIAQNPQVELIIVSRSLFKSLFSSLGPPHTFYPVALEGKHRGWFGLVKLFIELQRYPIRGVADLHQNIRSTLLTLLFKLRGIKTQTIHKDRAEKRAITRNKNKVLVPLTATTERYAEVFRRLGFTFNLKGTLIKAPQPLKQAILAITKPKEQLRWVGVSPFAQHPQKVYPLDKMHKVITHLADCGYRIFLFGKGGREQTIAEAWEEQHPLVSSIIHKLNLEEELDLISNLDLMISMDSSGMHLASLRGIPTLSVWGPTHPYNGFLGFGQKLEHCISLNLPCQPCSIYGNRACYRKDVACMTHLSEQDIAQKAKLILTEFNRHESY